MVSLQVVKNFAIKEGNTINPITLLVSLVSLECYFADEYEEIA